MAAARQLADPCCFTPGALGVATAARTPRNHLIATKVNGCQLHHRPMMFELSRLRRDNGRAGRRLATPDNSVDEGETERLVGPSDRDSDGRAPLGSPGRAGEYDKLMTGLCFLFPALGGALFGYDIGATSGALVSVTSAELSGTDWYSLTSFQSGAVVSSSLAGALAGSGAALVWGNVLGRRGELLLAAMCYGVAAVGMGAATGLVPLLLAHALYGLGIGFAMHAAPAYIAETAPPSVRGLLISLKEGFIVGGILLGYVASANWVDEVGGWRLMWGASAVPAAVLLAGMAWLPESPRFLLLSGKGAGAATDALVRIQGRAAPGPDAVAAEVAEMQRAAGGVGAVQPGFSALLRPPNLQPLLIGSSLMLFQQITGQPSVLYYAASIFRDAGFASAGDATKVAVVLGLFKLLTTGVAVATVDSLGRRPLLLLGVTCMVASLLALSAATGGALGAGATAVSIGALMLYVGAYQVSFGPVSWLMAGELFPLQVRSSALGVATLTNFGSNFAVSLALPLLQEGLGLSYTYLIFAAIGGVAVVSIYLTVPETKGKTLEEIEAMWIAEDRSGHSKDDGL